MRYREIGQSGIKASVVAFGAWAIGGWFWGGTEDGTAIAAIHAAIDNGMNLIDTAPMYGMGHSEVLVGKAIKGRRDKVVLATKCGLVWDGSNSGKGVFHFDTDEKTKRDDGPIKVYRYLNPASIRREVEQCLARLDTDYIDLFQTHWQESSTPIAESMGCLMDLKREGKIRAIGCANATSAQMDAYRAAGQLDVDQEQYSMLDRKYESSNLPYCNEHKISFLAYSPLSQGLLTGKIGPERVFSDGDQRIAKPRFSIENRKRITDLLATFAPLTNKYKCSLGQLAIAWTVAQPGCTHALCGARSPQQVLENLKGGDIVVSAEDSAFMREMVLKHAAEL
jgi:aryl-alcohol dehydrogenase-like predicted oxidoreductase